MSNETGRKQQGANDCRTEWEVGRRPDFSKEKGLVPAIVQHAETLTVLMLGYMNEEAFAATQETGRVTFFSRSRQELWQKGLTSGNELELVELLVDCDSDTILIKARPKGPTCHTGSESCFQRGAVSSLDVLDRISKTLESRLEQPSPQSYTSTLFSQGIDRIAQKVGEEATEVVIEAKNSNDEQLLNEAADLLFHLMALLTYRGVSIGQVCEVLKGRE